MLPLLGVLLTVGSGLVVLELVEPPSVALDAGAARGPDLMVQVIWIDSLIV